MSDHIFISYSHLDKTFSERVAHRLAEAGIAYWIDKSGLSPGTPNWEQAIREALQQASAVILIASPHSLQSNTVQGEIALAERYGLTIYPFWVHGNEWDQCIPLRMINTQFIDGRGTRYQSAINALVDTLTSANVIKTHLNAQQSQYLERILAIAPVGIIIADRGGQVLRVNRVALAMLEIDEDDVIGMSVNDLYADPEEAHKIGQLLRASEIGELFGYETRLRSRSGTDIPIRLAATWLYDSNGVGIGSAGAFEDMRGSAGQSGDS